MRKRGQIKKFSSIKAFSFHFLRSIQSCHILLFYLFFLSKIERLKIKSIVDLFHNSCSISSSSAQSLKLLLALNFFECSSFPISRFLFLFPFVSQGADDSWVDSSLHIFIFDHILPFYSLHLISFVLASFFSSQGIDGNYVKSLLDAVHFPLNILLL